MTESSKILIVDDEMEYRETYRMLLEGRGFFGSSLVTKKGLLQVRLQDVLDALRRPMAERYFLMKWEKCH